LATNGAQQCAPFLLVHLPSQRSQDGGLPPVDLHIECRQAVSRRERFTNRRGNLRNSVEQEKSIE